MSEILAEKKLENLEKYSSSFTFTTAKGAGLSAYQLKKAITDGKVKKVGEDGYLFSGYLEDELALISQKFSRGIFSGVTSLQLYNLTDEMPWECYMTFPKGYHSSTKSFAEKHIRAKIRSGKYYDEGISVARTSNDNPVRAYSVERALLDAWEDESIEIYVKNDACKKYLEYYYSQQSFTELIRLKQLLYPNSTLIKVLEVIRQ